MPKLKINRVVSFSSEDTNHKAANILTSEPTKKWKCSAKGEKSANLILQLDEASLISSIDIGNEHSAYVEVLVKRSGSTEDFKVLLVMSSFMSPLESRQSTNVNKVRMFTYNEFQSPERDEKWDVVKIVCTQPFNRHVQYGLSFLTLHTPGNKDGNALDGVKLGSSSEPKDGSATPVKLGKFTLRPISPNPLATGTLFSRRNLDLTNSPSAAAAIRDSSTSTNPSYKTPKLKIAAKPSTTPNEPDTSLDTSTDTSKRRNRDELLYSKDEEDSHEKIDNLMKKRKKELDEKQIAEAAQQKTKQKDKKPVANGKKAASPLPTTPSHATKRKQKDPSPKKIKVKKLSKPFYRLLDGVTIVISGIENPERSTIRNNALEMGAKYKPDWDNSCTHLICAFTNTPKFNQVKGKGKIVNRLWISDCYALRKRLPWRRYALDRNDLNKDESEDEICEDFPSSPDVCSSSNDVFIDDNSSTDDEIQTVSSVPKQHTGIASSYSVDTDEEIIRPDRNGDIPELPSILAHKKLYIDDELSEEEKKLLNRYIMALNGTVSDGPAEVDFIITTSKNVGFLKEVCSSAHAVTSDWVWDCYNENRLIPVNAFEL
uniref:BRCT domain-containing protein n=1 Tax=Photinus pyralis TaxID=7054 RepID=A0A1Y1KFD5_PHOPY